MIHLLPLAAGALAGLALVKILKTPKVRSGLDKAGENLRKTAAQGLEGVEQTAAQWKEKVRKPKPQGPS